MNIFEKASRLKLRFNLSKGVCTTEELWDLSLESLDAVAKALYKKIKENEDVSFIKEKTVANTKLDLQFEIVKHIINTKLAEKEAKKLATVKAEKAKVLKEIIAKKQLGALEGASLEALQAELDALEKE